MSRAVRMGLLAALALAAGCGGAPCASEAGLDGPRCATLATMALPASLPTSPTNAYADRDDAALLGFRAFFDARFSGTHGVRCATCHAPETHFDDARPVARGIDTVARNAPSALGVAWRTRSFMWDGRADVLWLPPVGAMENEHEMGFSRVELARLMGNADYQGAYQALFGALPDLSRAPAAGKPGDAAYDALTDGDRQAITRVAVNVGKSIEAYLRKLGTGRSPFDRYLAGEHDTLSVRQRLGMLVFLDAGCADCHGGPLLSDGKFHNLGVPAAAGAEPDPGRSAGIPLETAQELSPASPYSDAPAALTVAPATAADEGAFRTPTLRNVALTAPYMHNGAFATLGDAVDFHLRGGGRGQTGYRGSVDAALTAHALDDVDRAALLDFLSALTGEAPAAPWNDWPDRP